MKPLAKKNSKNSRTSLQRYWIAFNGILQYKESSILREFKRGGSQFRSQLYVLGDFRLIDSLKALALFKLYKGCARSSWMAKTLRML